MTPRLIRRAKRQAELAGHRLAIASDRTRSDLETLFLILCARYRLPPPEVNVKLGRWEVDFLWRAQRVVVETDYWSYHRGSVAFEDDHARELDLCAAGYTVLRFTDRLEVKRSGLWRLSRGHSLPASPAAGGPTASSRVAAVAPAWTGPAG